ncbi:MAG TPA: hypothetical protein VML75_09400 [Kofleriaceae bacterium]|nr:hypothetical protein [Kofleriaceae bacterium]
MKLVIAISVFLVSLSSWALAARAQSPAASRALARLEAREPSVDQVRAAALRYAGMDADRWKGWARRARLAGLLPDVTVRATRHTNTDRDLSRQSTGVERLNTGIDLDRAVEARATWHLDRLVFDPAEIRAVDTGQRHHRYRLTLAAQVTTIYYRRRRLQLRLLWRPPADPAERAERHLEIRELTDQLDGLTGGYFSRARKLR